MQIGLAAWIIQDGNYPDLKVGQQARFALEFYAHSFSHAATAVRSLTPTLPARYDFTGLIAVYNAAAWTIDFGLLAYDESELPEFAASGSFVAGDCYLGVDPFFYAEYLCKLPAMPELRYEWRINSILLETTPWITVRDSNGRESFQRDQTRSDYKAVSQTDAWHDDNGWGHYILDCMRITAD